MKLVKQYDSRQLMVHFDILDGPIVKFTHGRSGSVRVRIEHASASRYNDDDWWFKLTGTQIKKDGTDSRNRKKIDRYHPIETYRSDEVQDIIAAMRSWLGVHGFPS